MAVSAVVQYMSIVVEVISEYLLYNRRLVVPAFGAFVVKESGERVFSDLLRADDGILASLLHNRGLSDMEAAIMIDRFIFEVRHELERYGYCRLGDIGTLRVEPTTRALRLYPPVQGEIPQAKPYIPQPIINEQMVEVIPEVSFPNTSNTNTHNVYNTPNTPNAFGTPQESAEPKASVTPRKRVAPRKKFDFVMVVAVVIVTIALVAIGYGCYVSSMAEGNSDDDAAMDALRVIPEQIENR